jgi:hypothetical protein
MELTTHAQRAGRAEYEASQTRINAQNRREMEAADARMKAARDRNQTEAELCRYVNEARHREMDLLHEASGPQTRLSATRTLIGSLYLRAAKQDSLRRMEACPFCNGRCNEDETLAHIPELLKRCEAEDKTLKRLAKELEKAGEVTAATLEKYKAWQAKNPPIH